MTATTTPITMTPNVRTGTDAWPGSDTTPLRVIPARCKRVGHGVRLLRERQAEPFPDCQAGGDSARHPADHLGRPTTRTTEVGTDGYNVRRSRQRRARSGDQQREPDRDGDRGGACDGRRSNDRQNSDEHCTDDEAPCRSVDTRQPVDKREPARPNRRQRRWRSRLTRACSATPPLTTPRSVRPDSTRLAAAAATFSESTPGRQRDPHRWSAAARSRTGQARAFLASSKRPATEVDRRDRLSGGWASARTVGTCARTSANAPATGPTGGSAAANASPIETRTAAGRDVTALRPTEHTLYASAAGCRNTAPRFVVLVSPHR